MSYSKKSIDFFLNELSQRKPTPGGGSVAALTGALACGLLAMVCAFSQKGNNKSLKVIEKESLFYLDKLKDLMEEDVKSYKAFSLVFKSKGKTKLKIKRALQATLKPPLKTLRLVPVLMDNAKKLTRLSKTNIVSDVAVATSLILACFESASYNVKINVNALGDKKLTTSLNKEIVRLNKKLIAQKKDILASVDKRLKEN